MDPWQLLNEIENIGTNSLSATALAKEGSAWFDGHFPGEPILPGIALMHTVYSVIKQDIRARGEDLELYSLRRIRFTRPVRPGEAMDVNLSRDICGQDTVYSFKVVVKDNVVCSGMVCVAKAAKR
jgi:3-hydroxymyristoyl/3-hydroxydecanoyl-(acyl carrier protein) dehydratase